MMRKQLVLGSVLIAILRGGVAAADVVPLTTCGETIADAVLTADLDCSAAAGFAVTIADGGSLDLAGDRLTGTPTYGTVGPIFSDYAFGGAIECKGGCTISGGGGAIVSPAGMPAQTWWSTGVYGYRDFRRTTSNRKVTTIRDAEISGWTGFAVIAKSIEMTNCTVTGNQRGVAADRNLVMDACNVTSNAEQGVHTLRGAISNSNLTDNGIGLDVALAISLANSAVSGSLGDGVLYGRLVATGSTVTSNCVAPSFTPCADIRTSKRPRLRDSSCETSIRLDTTSSWGKCSLD